MTGLTRSLALLLTAAVITAQAGAAGADETPVATASDGFTVAVRPLDDPQNPYAGQYTQYDRWLLEHWRAEPTEDERIEFFGLQQEQREERYGRNYVLTAAGVEREGWLVPLMATRQQWEREFDAPTVRQQVNGNREYSEAPKPQLWAAGNMTEEMKLFMEEQYSLASASQYPAIPAWLGENPPLMAVFVPNGEILAYGEMGLKMPESMDLPRRHMLPPGEKWYRYSADGKLLGTHELYENWGAGDWRRVYNPLQGQFTVPGEDAAQLAQFGVVGGFTALYRRPAGEPPNLYTMYDDRKSYEVVAAFDYDGTPVDPDAPQSPARMKQGIGILGEMLGEYYAAQLQLGITSADTSSPWVGTPEGPQFGDPAGWKPKVVATRGQHPTEEGVIVRGLDDPQNPYRGQYREWDRWLIDSVGAQNPKMTAYMNDLHARQYAEVRKAKAEGREPDTKLMEAWGYPHDPTDPWRHYDIQVDAQGFPLPQLVTVRQRREWQRELHPEHPGPFPPQAFSLQAGGVMSEGMEAELAREEWAAVQDLFPRIPDWLIEQPVEMAYFTPAGDIVTRGPKGWFTEAARGMTHAQQRGLTDYVLYRYSAGGELLARYDNPEALSLAYNPMYLSTKLAAEAQGYKIDTQAMYMKVEKPGTRELVEVYDYDGTPLGTAGPFVRDTIAGSGLYYTELVKLHAAQQRAGRTE